MTETARTLVIHSDAQQLVGNAFAYAAPITYDLTTGAIGVLEVLEWVSLAAVYVALTATRSLATGSAPEVADSRAANPNLPTASRRRLRASFAGIAHSVAICASVWRSCYEGHHDKRMPMAADVVRALGCPN